MEQPTIHDQIESLIIKIEQKSSTKGVPLSQIEKDILRSNALPSSTYHQQYLFGLVKEILEDLDEAGKTELSDLLSQINERDQPYVLFLLQDVICEHADLDPTHRSWILDKLFLLVVGLIVVLGMLAIVSVLGFLGLFK